MPGRWCLPAEAGAAPAPALGALIFDFRYLRRRGLSLLSYLVNYATYLRGFLLGEKNLVL